jgi:hypothetical protein
LESVTLPAISLGMIAAAPVARQTRAAHHRRAEVELQTQV